MSLNLTEVLQPKARAFVKAHEDTLNAMLEPELFAAGLRMARFGGPAARDLVQRFARAQQAFQILRVEATDADGVMAEVILSGRQTANRLILLPPETAATINLELLSAIAARGDIPQISYGGKLSNGALYLIQEIPSGRP